MEKNGIFELTMNTCRYKPNINLDRQKLPFATKVGGSKSQMDQSLIQADIILI
jgi:hypothetical protein